MTTPTVAGGQFGGIISYTPASPVASVVLSSTSTTVIDYQFSASDLPDYDAGRSPLVITPSYTLQSPGGSGYSDGIQATVVSDDANGPGWHLRIVIAPNQIAYTVDLYVRILIALF